MITSGAIEALELVGKSFLDRGDVVVVEGPTYLGAIQAFRSFEAEVVAIPMDEHGLEVDELERRLADGLRPKLVYTIPDHQNPAGVSLSRERRELLVELARRHGFLIVEDVAYRELGFDGRHANRVFGASRQTWSCRRARRRRRCSPVCGSAGRSVRPKCRRSSFRRSRTPTSARVRSDSGSSRSTSAAAGSTSSSRSRESLYRRKCERMLAALERCMPVGTHWTFPKGGFFSWLTLPDGGDAADLATRAVERGVAIVPGSLFFPDDRGGDNVRLSFSLVDEAKIDDGIERLASLVKT